MSDMERLARMGLCAVTAIAPRETATELNSILRTHPQFGELAEELWAYLLKGHSTTPELDDIVDSIDLNDLHRQTEECGTRFIIPFDDEWTRQLDDLNTRSPLYRSPYGLWVSGPASLNTACAHSIAVVGSRAATAYGEHVTAELCTELAQKGTTIVSGGSYGIDSSAHRSALAARSAPTIAVLAGGLANLYPEGNASLFKQIASTGALVSESPPSARPSRAEFLRRNRLIPALTQATVIVEGAQRSGTQHIATWAWYIDRPIGAVPGPITSAASAHPHRLLREGTAHLVTSADDILALTPPIHEHQELSRYQSPCQQPVSAITAESSTARASAPVSPVQRPHLGVRI